MLNNDIPIWLHYAMLIGCYKSHDNFQPIRMRDFGIVKQFND